ncbi:hypothetical protein C8F04DRAFT_1139784 [Mycena alexandri]|uniref:Uncharacterized protein n=1 Tax=Mycena alexandri TaxID=1745969 RepID=A0AAD6S5W8_9AGAR|nr:hypothetical protein C8F04DRAFT_1139784 [Mycena alexandri]
MVDNLGHFATEVPRVSRDVGTEGKLGAPSARRGRRGDMARADGRGEYACGEFDYFCGIAAVTSAVATEDLSKQIDLDVRRRPLLLYALFLFLSISRPFYPRFAFSNCAGELCTFYL